MSAILDMPGTMARVRLWTVADYRALAEDNPAFDHSELIQGIIVNKMSKTWLHEKLTDLIAEYLRSVVGVRKWVRQEASLVLADSVPEPDVAVVAGTRDDYDGRKPTTAELVVEIAVTSIAADREKAAVYAEAGVGEYWIVLAETGQVEVYRLAGGRDLPQPPPVPARRDDRGSCRHRRVRAGGIALRLKRPSGGFRSS